MNSICVKNLKSNFVFSSSIAFAILVGYSLDGLAVPTESCKNPVEVQIPVKDGKVSINFCEVKKGGLSISQSLVTQDHYQALRKTYSNPDNTIVEPWKENGAARAGVQLNHQSPASWVSYSDALWFIEVFRQVDISAEYSLPTEEEFKQAVQLKIIENNEFWHWIAPSGLKGHYRGSGSANHEESTESFRQAEICKSNQTSAGGLSELSAGLSVVCKSSRTQEQNSSLGFRIVRSKKMN